MSRETEAPFLDPALDTEENVEWVSKSQLKRDSEALKALGKKLCALNAEQLAKVPLDEPLQDAITLAHKIANKRGALKRHYQFIGKLLRSMDVEPIQKAMDEIEQISQGNKQAFKMVEHWRDRILGEGDPAIHEFCQQHDKADRQKLRQLWRNHAQCKDENKQTVLARELFKELRDRA